jgi:hypothetical protein
MMCSTKEKAPESQRTTTTMVALSLYLLLLLAIAADGKPAGDTGETTCLKQYETFDTKLQGNMEMQLEGHNNTCMARFARQWQR